MAYIPSFHFDSAKEKLTPEWCDKVIQFYRYQSFLTGLLDGKNLAEIDGYADGTYDMSPFKRMFRSMRDQMTKAGQTNYSAETLAAMDKTGINWDRVPLIAPKLNTAIATTQKRPLEVTCTCIDALAQRKKKEDLEFLRNKPMMEAVMQEMYDTMGLGKVDMGPTKHSAVPYTSLPLDLDIDDDQEFMLFANVIYNLAPEAAFETILQLYTETKRVANIKLMETRDQYRYAVSVNQCVMDKITGLPDPRYVYAGNVQTDGSILPDFSDNIIRIISEKITPMELFKRFGDEIKDETALEKIIGTSGAKGEWGSGYCACNGRDTKLGKADWHTFKMDLKYVEVKSVDSMSIGMRPKTGDKYFTDDPEQTKAKIWGENTYCFYWLHHTKWFFGIDKLPYSNREKGKEKYQRFSTNIYKSNEKSAVELSIGENKKAQMADIKLQHNIIMSMPPGKVIDMKFLRNVLEGVKAEDNLYTIQDLIDKAVEHNMHIIDSEGFEGKREGQMVPVSQLPGGLGTSIEGYYRVILEADNKIGQYTNINPQLTGQSINAEGLVGLQKLLINSSLNGLFYVDEALLRQYTALYTLMANGIKQSIEAGGATKRSIESVIGTNKVEILDKMDDVALHDIGVTIRLGQREEERAMFQQEVELMRREGKIDSAAKYYILNVANPKDAFLLTAMFERKWQKKQDERLEKQLQTQQQIVQQQGQNALANTQAQNEGKAALKEVEGKVESDLMRLAAKLGLDDKQVDGLIKRQLQQDRINGQVDKSLKTLYAKNNLEQQKAIA